MDNILYFVGIYGAGVLLTFFLDVMLFMNRGYRAWFINNAKTIDPYQKFPVENIWTSDNDIEDSEEYRNNDFMRVTLCQSLCSFLGFVGSILDAICYIVCGRDTETLESENMQREPEPEFDFSEVESMQESEENTNE